MTMKTVFILLTAMGLFGFNGFAGEQGLSTPPGKRSAREKPATETDWTARLQSGQWREREKAVRDWRVALPQFQPREILSHLKPRLFDRSQKVREAMPGAFADLVESYPALAMEIIETVMSEVQDNRAEMFALIETAGKKGLSRSDYKIRQTTIDLLTKVGETHPFLSPNIIGLLETRRKQEQSHHVKIHLKQALRKLKRLSENGQSSSCDEKLWHAASAHSSVSMG